MRIMIEEQAAAYRRGIEEQIERLRQQVQQLELHLRQCEKERDCEVQCNAQGYVGTIGQPYSSLAGRNHKNE